MELGIFGHIRMGLDFISSYVMTTDCTLSLFTAAN